MEIKDTKERAELILQLNRVGDYSTHKELWDAYYKFEELVKKCSIPDVGLTLPLPDENSMRQIAQHVRNSEDIRDPLIYEQGIIRGMQIMKNIVLGN